MGEFANKVKKTIRDRNDLLFEDAVGELGDILWYLSELSRHIAPRTDNSLGYIAYMNIEKLKDRARRNKIKGSGDNR
jgi:NTP pyrophosphatase (non-canonical NTP hydrolase)